MPIRETEIAAASVPTPAANKKTLFLDTDGEFKTKDESGTVAGLTGAQGDPGEGVPTGGTAGQFLRKASGTDFDTAFAAVAQSEVTNLVTDLAAKAPTASPTFTGTVTIPDDPYDATGWNGNLTPPTKNAVRDKIEALGAAGTLDDLTDVDTTGVADGDVLTYDSGSGDWVAAAPTGGAGALTLLASQTASASASLNFNARNAAGQSGAMFQSDYDHYVIVMRHLVNATNSVDFYIRFSNDTGSSFDSGSQYLYSNHLHRSGGDTVDSVSALTTQIKLAGGIANDATWGLCGRLDLFRGTTSIHARLIGQSNFFQDSGGLIAGVSHSALYVAHNPVIDAILFLFSSGNITSGEVLIYGVAN